MPATDTVAELRNAVQTPAPLLSIVVPYKDYDVLPLAGELIEQATQLDADIEILFADDGSSDRGIGEALLRCFEQTPVACGLLSATVNVGRSRIRNRLAEHARGRFLLYLDADMLPDDAHFLQRYVDLLRKDRHDVLCGGRSYLRATRYPPQQAFYRYFSLRTECIDAQARNRQPLWHLLTNNLCVRRSLVRERPFVEAYQGWGFEDADWALRLHGARVLHIDNPSTHMGLIDDDELLRKYDSSRANFLLIADSLPEFRRFSIYRASRRLARMPLPATAMRAICAHIVCSRRMPMRLRFVAMQAYRMALYAGVLRESGHSHLPDAAQTPTQV